MKTYLVTVPERWDQTYRVKANSPEEAREIVNNCEAKLDGKPEYIGCVLDLDWEVEEI